MKPYAHSFRQPEYWQLFDFRNPVSDIWRSAHNTCVKSSQFLPHASGNPAARTPAEWKQNTTALWDHSLTEALWRVSKIGCYFFRSMAWCWLAPSHYFNQYCHIVKWTHVSKFKSEYDKLIREKAYERSCLESGPSLFGLNMIKMVAQSRRKIIFCLVKRKFLCSDWNWHLFCWVRMTRYVPLAHVGPT